MDRKIKPAQCIKGSLVMPGDKSISHRALMCSAIAKGKSEIVGLSNCRDVLSTMHCIRSLGVDIRQEGEKYLIKGKGLAGFSKPVKILDAGNSGTTIRLLAGILAGQKFSSEITGDDSLKTRPMARILEPLRKMGADISGFKNNFAPLKINPGKLFNKSHQLKIASGQVKSCLLFAAMYANGSSIIQEPAQSRDHTERMLKSMGANIDVNQAKISLNGSGELTPQNFIIPGDISSAAFFLVAASILKNTKLEIKKVGLNETRTGILDILTKMGVSFEIRNKRILNYEESGDIIINSSELNGIEISGEIIPKIIDEIPIISIAASQANGNTIIRDAKELRVKESDRIKTTVKNLRRMGCKVKELEDGMIIEGRQKLKGAVLDSFGDHRIAMAFSIAGLAAEGETIIKNSECVDISFPGFFKQLKEVTFG